MARKKIREYDSKRLLKEHFKRLGGYDLAIKSAQVIFFVNLQMLNKSLCLIDSDTLPFHLAGFHSDQIFNVQFNLSGFLFQNVQIKWEEEESSVFFKLIVKCWNVLGRIYIKNQATYLNPYDAYEFLFLILKANSIQKC